MNRQGLVTMLLPSFSINKETKDTARPASYLVLHLTIDSECHLRTKLCDKRYFNFLTEFSIYMWQHSSSTCIAYWLDIHELVFSIRNFWIENCDYHFETITVAIMAWVSVTEYLCHTWHRISFFVALTVPRSNLINKYDLSSDI